MPEQVNLKIGSREVAYQRSDDQIAVRPSTFTRFALENFEKGASDPSRVIGSLADYDIVRLETGTPEQFSEIARGAVRSQHVYHTSDDGVPFLPTGRITLGLDGELGQDTEAYLNENGLTFERKDGPSQFTVRTAGDAVEVSALLQKDSAVAFAEPDFSTLWQTFDSVSVNDPNFAEQWHLRNTGYHRGTSHKFTAGADARVVQAWQELGHFGSHDVIVGIVDDGFDFAHPDLAGRGVAPFDFETGTDDVSPRYHGDNQGDWHGTGCAGLAAGQIDGGEIVGVAPNSRIMPIRIGPEFDEEKLHQIFHYLAEHGAWLVNCSWGPTSQNYPLGKKAHDAISYCVNSGRGGLGTPVLFAAGNKAGPVSDGDIHNGLAAHPDVICVSASTSQDGAAQSSNYGPEVAICAPSGGNGWSLTTADVTGHFTSLGGQDRPLGYRPGDYTDFFAGTSGACAVAAGVCALLLSAAPTLTARQLRAVLTQSARKIGGVEAYGNSAHSVHFGRGCVDAAEGVRLARRMAATG